MLEVKPTGQRGRMAEMGGAYRFARQRGDTLL